MAKLKSALLAHQSQSAKRASQARSAEAKKAKEASIKASVSGSKKAKKKASRQGPPGPSRTSTLAQTPTATHPPSASASSSAAVIPFDRTDTILLLGEANFSFALSLVLSPRHAHPPSQLCATSYDSEEVCYTKYPDARENVQRLRERGVRVGFGVDAGDLEGKAAREVLGVKKKGKEREGRWSRVIFNFPHVGQGITDQDRNILANQTLLLRTFRSVAPLLTTGPSAFPVQPTSTSTSSKSKKRPRSPSLSPSPEPHREVTPPLEPEYDPALHAASSEPEPPKREGTILITLLNQPPYTLWRLSHLATRPPPTCPGTRLPQPAYRLLRSFRFDPDVYPGYEHRRTLGFKEGVSKRANKEIKGRKGEGRCWEFALASS